MESRGVRLSLILNQLVQVALVSRSFDHAVPRQVDQPTLLANVSFDSGRKFNCSLVLSDCGWF
jgi:hypothetical protein